MIPVFPALRFFNALLIFTHHANALIDNPYLLALGPSAVSFFLMLSGFVMGYGYEYKVLAPEFNYKNYWFKRFFRIYPLHLLCLILWIGLKIKSIVSWNLEDIFGITCNLFLCQSWIPKTSVYFSGNAVSWCLSDLIFFYSIFPFVIKVFRKKSRMIAFTTVYFIVYVVIIPFIPGNYIHAFVYINPCFRFADFYIGMLLYKIYKTYKINFEKFNVMGYILQTLSVAVSCFAIFIYKYVPECIRFQSLFFVPNAMTVISFAFFEKTFILKLLCFKVLKWFGEISFTFYMLHGLGMLFINYVISHFGLEVDLVYKILLYLSFDLIGSAIVHVIYEKPIARKFQKSNT